MSRVYASASPPSLSPLRRSPPRETIQVKAVLDPYNPGGSTSHVNFNTSKELRYKTDHRRRHINWVVVDSDWEVKFCRVVEPHPQARAYVKTTISVSRARTATVPRCGPTQDLLDTKHEKCAQLHIPSSRRR